MYQSRRGEVSRLACAQRRQKAFELRRDRLLLGQPFTRLGFANAFLARVPGGFVADRSIVR